MAVAKHKKGKGHFAGVPSIVMRHPDYINLGSNAKVLLFEFALQYYRTNNGKLCAVFSQMKNRGFKSETTLRKAIKELLDAKLIILTKIGMYGRGQRLPNYYAVTWQPIDDVKGFEMDIPSTITPPRAFSIELRQVQNDKAA
jgi:hypothetical protein